ncbi:MAG TPA: efflux RND transporter periplasmic adaptor subunit [Polyangia bacterium]|nr:efflux RND transporter periplasmic adaptor subunit [Polyangia bacterium]
MALFGGLILVAGLVAWARRPPAVMLTPAVRGTAVDAVYASGTVEAIDRVEIKARLNGAVDAILVKEGDRVTREQVLARLDVPTARIELDRERSELEAAQQRTASALAVLEAQERILQAQLSDARAELKKAEQLSRNGSATPRELERAQLQVTVLEQQLAMVQAQRRETGATRQAEVRRSESALATSRSRVRDAEVRAPIEGDVLHVLVDLGQLVQPGESLIRVGDARRLHIEALVDEEDVGRVRLGAPCVVRLNSFPAEVFPGRVRYIAPEAERERHSFEIYVTLDRAPDGLRPGMSAEINVIVAQKERALLVPREAVVDGQVWRYEQDGEVHRRPVKTGLGGLEQVELVEGLAEGDRIVARPEAPPIAGLKAETLSVRPAAAPPSSSAPPASSASPSRKGGSP